MEIKNTPRRIVQLTAIIAFFIVMLSAEKVSCQTLYSADVDPTTGNITVKWNDIQPALTSGYKVRWGTTVAVADGSASLFVPMAVNTLPISVDARLTRYYIQVEKTLIAGAPVIINFSTIYTSLTPNPPVSGVYTIAYIQWNPVEPTLAGDYYVERFETPAWKSVKKIAYQSGLTNYIYHDTVSSPFCTSSNIQYRVKFVPQVAFNNSISNVVSDGPFGDYSFPANVLNDTVSVNRVGLLKGHPVIGWQPSPSNDIAGYTIKRKDVTAATAYTTVTTVPYGTNFYIDNAVLACDNIYAYAVVSVDKCGKESFGTYAIPDRQTIQLTALTINPCDRKASLSWTTYHSMPGGLNGYKIYRQDNGNAFIQITDIKDSTKTTYDDFYNFVNNHTYTYFVKAYSINGIYSSTSCEKNSIYKGSNSPDTVWVTQVTVENDNYVKASYHFEPPNTVKNIILQRADVASGPWIDIKTQIPTSNFGSINDSTANVHAQSYYYRFSVSDSCNLNPLLSINTGTSIYLQQQFSSPDNSVFWNSYDAWLKGVSGYDVYRQVDGKPVNGDLLTTVSGNTYTESSAAFPAETKICYWIVAHEKQGNLAASVSNICCIIKEATLFMPNAFTPDAPTNNRFRPVATYVDPLNFNMKIFDKWGQKLFETNNIYNGWDGYVNGQHSSAGLYSYIVTYKSTEGQDYIKRGTLLIIR